VIFVSLVASVVRKSISRHAPRARCGRIELSTSGLALVLAAALVSGAGAQSKERPRLFLPLDLGLIEAPDRDQWQKPDQIMDALSIADGSVVAELGAAGGWFTIRLARRVGPLGRVYAEDIQPEMLEAITRRVQHENLSNVTTVLGTAIDPRLPGGLDAVLIVDAYHEMEFDESGRRRRDPVTLLRNVARSLKPQGRLGVVDFTPGGGGPGPDPDQRVDPQSVIRATAAAGLQLIAREAVPPFDFLLVFGRAPGGRGSP
jgi:predicted methyltransferase